MTYELCAIGNAEFLIPFSLFGFTTYSPPSTDALREYLENLIRQGEVGIVYIEDSYCFPVKDILEAPREAVIPIFMPVGEAPEGKSYFEHLQKESMAKAIGLSAAL